MVEATDNRIPTELDMRVLPAPAAGWMWIQEAFSSLTEIVGPHQAVRDLDRALVAGRVSAMRRRPLDDGVEESVLPPAFWRDVKLKWGRDEQGRECIGQHLGEGVDKALVSGCIFYLSREQFHKAFPATKPKPPRKSKAKVKEERVLHVLADLDRENRLPRGLRPAEVEKIVLPVYRTRWPELEDEKKKRKEPVSRNYIFQAYLTHCDLHPK